MDLGLTGRVALVTGGRRGIGGAVVRALAAAGCDVAVVDQANDDAMAATVAAVEEQGRRAYAVEADVRDFARAESVVAEVEQTFGRLDVLVCCAGITRDHVVWKLTESEWDDVLDVNLKGCFNYGRAVAPVFRRREWGRIVNIASINGLRGKFGQANYAASKAGVIALSKTLARELGRWSVTANAVAPGMVVTDMTRDVPSELVDAAVADTTLGRLATQQDVADLVVFLSSERAASVTGEVIRVDGGQYI
jgi:3-oxoacyl-[acyl-carrier protein] reductase